MKVRDLYSFIDGFAPFSSAESWDNSGLLIGNLDSEVKRVLLCLDITKREAELAEEKEIDLVISHHPVIFHPLRSISSDSVYVPLIKNGVSVICAHTNLDKAPGGVNDSLCEKLGMKYEKASADIAGGFLNIGSIPCIDTALKLAKIIAEKLNATVSYIDSGRAIAKTAVCSGAGSDFIGEAASLGCDSFITGEASYHSFLEAQTLGVSLFAAGHFETENMICVSMKKYLSTKFPDIEFIISDRLPPVITVR